MFSRRYTPKMLIGWVVPSANNRISVNNQSALKQHSTTRGISSLRVCLEARWQNWQIAGASSQRRRPPSETSHTDIFRHSVRDLVLTFLIPCIPTSTQSETLPCRCEQAKKYRSSCTSSPKCNSTSTPTAASRNMAFRALPTPSRGANLQVLARWASNTPARASSSKPRPIDDSTSALDCECGMPHQFPGTSWRCFLELTTRLVDKMHRPARRLPHLSAQHPRAPSAEEAVTNILYNTPPPSTEPYKR